MDLSFLDTADGVAVRTYAMTGIIEPIVYEVEADSIIIINGIVWRKRVIIWFRRPIVTATTSIIGITVTISAAGTGGWQKKLRSGIVRCILPAEQEALLTRRVLDPG